jgi:hypothetical protein
MSEMEVTEPVEVGEKEEPPLKRGRGNATVQFQCSDGVLVSLPASTFQLSNFVRRHMAKDSASTLLLEDVASAALEDVVSFCDHYADDVLPDIDFPLEEHEGGDKLSDQVNAWYVAFVDQMALEPGEPLWSSRLGKLIEASETMEVLPLSQLVCAAASRYVAGQTPPELRAWFGVADEFKPGEEDARVAAGAHDWIPPVLEPE